MTGNVVSSRVYALIEQRAGGDRSVAFGLHAVISECDAEGVAIFNDVAIRFRDDWIAAIRAQGAMRNGRPGGSPSMRSERFSSDRCCRASPVRA